jgi:hypothetical protein
MDPTFLAKSSIALPSDKFVVGFLPASILSFANSLSISRSGLAISILWNVVKCLRNRLASIASSSVVAGILVSRSTKKLKEASTL